MILPLTYTWVYAIVSTRLKCHKVSLIFSPIPWLVLKRCCGREGFRERRVMPPLRLPSPLSFASIAGWCRWSKAMNAIYAGKTRQAMTDVLAKMGHSPQIIDIRCAGDRKFSVMFFCVASLIKALRMCSPQSTGPRTQFTFVIRRP
jgi:hypothetical protein